MAILKNKLVLIIVAVLLLGGGGAYYFLFMGKAPEASAKKKGQSAGQHGEEAQAEDGDLEDGEAHASEEDGHGDEEADEEADEEDEDQGGGNGGGHGESKGPIMEPFVVNLADPGSRRYVRLSLKLHMKKPEESGPLLETRMPQVRDAVLMLLSNKTTDQLVSAEGKTALREELIAQINTVLKKKKLKRAVKNLYFTEFLIQ